MWGTPSQRIAGLDAADADNLLHDVRVGVACREEERRLEGPKQGPFCMFLVT